MNQECIICIEEDNCVLIKKNQHCDCEYSVHKKCLHKWIKKQNKCVICRKMYKEKDKENMSFLEGCFQLALNFWLYTLLCTLLFFLTFGILFALFYVCVKIF